MSNSPVCWTWIKSISAILIHGSSELDFGFKRSVCQDRLEVASWCHEDQGEENAGTFGIDNHGMLCGLSEWWTLANTLILSVIFGNYENVKAKARIRMHIQRKGLQMVYPMHSFLNAARIRIHIQRKGLGFGLPDVFIFNGKVVEARTTQYAILY